MNSLLNFVSDSSFRASCFVTHLNWSCSQLSCTSSVFARPAHTRSRAGLSEKASFSFKATVCMSFRLFIERPVSSLISRFIPLSGVSSFSSAPPGRLQVPGFEHLSDLFMSRSLLLRVRSAFCPTRK